MTKSHHNSRCQTMRQQQPDYTSLLSSVAPGHVSQVGPVISVKGTGCSHHPVIANWPQL